jgi:phage terminase large subunit-like protein
MNKAQKTKLEKTMRLIPGFDPFATAGDCVFEHEAAQHVIDFFAERLVLIEGKTAGRPFKLEGWQQAIVGNLFGWKRPDGTRRFRRSFVFVGRKNGKTPLCAGIINYVAFCDGEPGAQIYSAAGEREQAALVFRHAAGMINRNPLLAANSRIYRTYKSIEFYGGNTVYKALSADADTKHGLNAHLVIVDELHVQPNRDLVDTLTTSTASRTQPLEIDITTAGVYDVNSICFEHYDYACKVRDGIIADPYFLPVVYETAKNDNWKDEAVWLKANPNIGVSVSMEYLRQACKEAQEVPAKENTFRRLHLNQWTEQDTRWVSMDVWNEGHDDFPEEQLEGQLCYAGIDLSSTRDLTSVSLYFPETGHVMTYPFIPKANAEKRERKDRVPYMTWHRQGFIEMTDGDVVDYAFIRDKIKNLAEKFNIKAIAADPWNAVQLILELQQEGFDVHPMRQGFTSMTAPTKELERRIIERSLKHNSPVLDWCMSNVMVEQDPAGNLKPSKKKSTEKIDCVVSLINAIGVALANPEVLSVYDSREPLTI